MNVRSCVTADGRFVFAVHRPAYRITNLRSQDFPATLGWLPDATPVDNQRNFPPGEVEENKGELVYEIPNPFPFRGTTYISGSWAEARATNPAMIRLPPPDEVSMRQSLERLLGLPLDSEQLAARLAELPRTVRLTLAATSTDPADLTALARLSCGLVERNGQPAGLRYLPGPEGPQPEIHDHDLFEVVGNNPHLPDPYKLVMVLRPGVQGGSEIVGEYGGPGQQTHVFEYLRRNSYIPWGHFAANLAHDAIRYSTRDLTLADMTGLRHLYYQRSYLRLAEMAGISAPASRRSLDDDELETLRRAVLARLASRREPLPFTGILWGWNYGFDFAASGFRLHASHQQIHQQFALVPAQVAGPAGTAPLDAYGCGDLVTDFCQRFRQETGRGFFTAYLEALASNQRLDNGPGDSSLVIHEDENVILFVPKAQVSQWELQLMAKQEVGNILEADPSCRRSLDRGILVAQKLLAALGARLVTSIEYSKRIDSKDRDQRLFYSFLPKLPYAMGAFSEAQLRWVSSHFPEDFAIACRSQLDTVLAGLETA